MNASPAQERTVFESLQEYGRGVAGGLMFSLPLLYTMEVWWTGFIAHPWQLAVCVAVTFLLLLGYNRYAGLRRDAGMAEVMIDSVEELGIGLVLAAGVLWLLGRVTADMPWIESVGKVVTEAMTVAIGVSVGTAQLGGSRDGEEKDGGGMDSGRGKARRPAHRAAAAKDHPEKGERRETRFGGQLTMALCGAVLFSVNVAPTEEIIMIGQEISWRRLAGVALLSLTLGGFILYYSEFRGSKDYVRHGGFKTMMAGTVVTYAVALTVSAAILWFFGRFDGVIPYTGVSHTIVLGLAATLGASAGRLLLQ